MLNPENMPRVVFLGFQGEDSTRVLEFDCTEWVNTWPGGTFGVTYTTPCDDKPKVLSQAYVGSMGAIVNVTIPNEMTKRCGMGTICLSMKIGERFEKRSRMAATEVYEGQLC